MMESSQSSSDEELDQAELESVLYSQTHFDTSLNSELLPRVHTQPSPSRRAAHKQPLQEFDIRDFKVFPKDKNVLLNDDEMTKWYNLGSPASEIPVRETNCTKIQEKLKKKEESDSNSNLNETHSLELPKKIVLAKNQISAISASCSNKDFEQKKVNVPKGHSTVKKSQNLLPFQITKKVKNSVSCTTQFVVIEDDAERKDETLKEDLQKAAINSKSVKEKHKIQDFLELSPIKQAKQKRVRKCEAAVKSRKPEVQIRRLPPAIPVRYRQDSDTETDYSDSESSGIPTPSKSQNNSSMNESQETTASGREQSQSEKAVDYNEDIEVIVSDENNLSNEDIKTNLRNAESKRKTDHIMSSNAEVHSVSEETSDDDEEEEEEEDSDASACALEDNMPVPFMPSLDFNLAGGVSKLLSGESGPKPEESKELWKIDEKDKYNLNYLTSRYFAPRPIQCRNCRKNGHLSRDCPEPLRQRCIFCCEEGHQFKSCPQAICHNCYTPGHKLSDCKEARLDWKMPCDRCWMTGHTEQMCPDRWRQLHLSINVDNLYLRSNHKSRLDSDEKKNTRVFCYNCGIKGHWGYECRFQRMNRFVPPSYPFVAYYDRKSDILKTHCTSAQMKSIKGREKASKKSGRSKGVSKQRQYKQEKVCGDMDNKHSVNERRGMNKRKHKRQEEDFSRNHRKSDRLVPRDLSQHEYDRKDQNKLLLTDANDHLPSTSKAHQRKHNLSNTSRSPKSRKRHWKDDSPEIESEDSFDAMEQHQVSRNEWWLSKPEANPKQRKKARGSRQDIKVEHRSLSHNWENPGIGSRYQTWHEEQSCDEHPSHFQSSFDQPETTFVYVDEHPPSLYKHNTPYLSPKRDRFLSPQYTQTPSRHIDSPVYHHTSDHHHSDRTQHHWNWDRDRSLPKAARSMRHSNTRDYGNRHKDKTSGRPSRGGHVDKKGSHGRNNNASSQRNNKHRSGGWRHKESASWPGTKKEQKTKIGPSLHNRGFKSQHERFVTMKNDCDISVSMRK